MPAETDPADTDPVDLGFLLVSHSELPTHEAVVAAAAARGIALTPTPDPEKDAESRSFTFDEGGDLVVARMGAPHPDAAHLCMGIGAPDLDEAKACPDHWIVTVLRPSGDVRARDARMYRILGALAEAGPVVGGMLTHGWSFVDAGRLRSIEAAEESRDQLPAWICLDVSVARDEEGALSAMTHNMPRYGREDVMIWSRVEEAEDTIGFLYSIAAWMMEQPADAFPSGDTIGRTADEKWGIEREPSPADESATVIVLRKR